MSDATELQADRDALVRVLRLIAGGNAKAFITLIEPDDADVEALRRVAPESSPMSKRPLRGMALVQTWVWICRRCLHQWPPRDWKREPKVCPKCKSPYWNTPRRVR